MIVGVAIRIGGVMFCLPKPNRHVDCFNLAFQSGMSKALIAASTSDDQGFYTEAGVYLTRPEAAKHAYEKGQLGHEHGLCSEEYW